MKLLTRVLLALLALSWLSSPAYAQQGGTAQVVSACGTNNQNPPVGTWSWLTMAANGQLCTSGSGGGGGGAVTIASGADVTEGSTTDTAGTSTVLGQLKAVVAAANAPPAPNPVTSNAAATQTVTTGGTFQTLLASNSSRKGCLIQNPLTATEELSVFVGSGTASVNGSFHLAAGASFTCNFGFNVITDALQVTAATTGHQFVERDQ